MEQMHSRFLASDATPVGSTAASRQPETGPAFPPDSQILTREGMSSVGQLRPGDRVMTRDHGLQTVRHVVHGRPGWHALGLVNHLRPVQIDAAAFGPGLPLRQMLIQPDQGVAVRLAGTEDPVILPARRLAGCPGVRRVAFEDRDGVCLFFDQPVLVNVEGLWCEAAALPAQAQEPVTESIEALLAAE